MTAVTGVTAAAVALVAIPAVRHGELAGVLLAAVILLSMAAFEAVRPLARGRRQHRRLRRRGDPHRGRARRAGARRRSRRAGRPARRRRPRAARRALPLRRRRPVAARRRRPAPRARPCGGARWAPAAAARRRSPSCWCASATPSPGDVALGGVAVRDAAQDDLRAAVCLGAQDAHLFAGTLAENLALARPGATPADLEHALARVGLGPWLASLPDGLATTVGEHGAKVSGGQRRRIAAARLLLSPARFLIADEPAAHLDAERRRGAHRASSRARPARGAACSSSPTSPTAWSASTKCSPSRAGRLD